MTRKPTLVFPILILFLLASCEPISLTSVVPPEATKTPVAFTETSAPRVVTETPFVSVETITPTLETIGGFTETPSAPKWWEVYFTDPLTINDPNNPAGSIEEKLIGFINNAQTSIHIASFEFDLPRVAEALIKARQERNVDVRWVTDNKYGLEDDEASGLRLFASLEEAGVGVQDDAGRSAYMHNKFWIFDGQIVWTGSTNITESGIYTQNNNVLVVHSTDVANIYEREWRELWSKQFGPRAPSTVNNQWAILDGSAVLVLFSAEDHALSQLIAMVNEAKTSVRFLAFSFTDYPLAKAMIDRAAAGVNVQGVYETFGSTGIGSEMKTFFCAKVPVRQDGNPSFLHDKIIIIDDNIVITGSLNFSSNAENSNEENVLIVDNAEVAALYLQEYEKIWNQAHDLNPADFPCP